MIEIIL